MKLDNHPIDQLFREKLGSLEQTPRFGLMAQISEGIISQRKVRRLNQFKAVVGIAAAIVLILMAGLYTIDQKPLPNAIISQQIQLKSDTEQQALEKAAITTQKVDTKVALNIQQSEKATSNIKGKQSKANSIQKNKTGNSLSTTANSKTEPPKTAPSLASSDQLKEQQQDGQGKNQSATESAKKKSNPIHNNNQQKNYSYYSGNSNNSSQEKKSALIAGLWSLKAEISGTFTAMLSGGSSSGVDTKSLNTVGGGMVASYKINDKLSISSGIRFSQMKQDSHSSYSLNNTSGIIYLQPVEKNANLMGDVSLNLPAVSSIVYSNGMKSMTSTSNVFVSNIAQEFKYIEIPIQATYKLMDKKISVGLTGGISTNFLVGNFASVTENGILLSKGNTDNIRNVLYSGSAGIEVGYDLGNNLRLTIEPRVKQFMHSVSSNDLINVKPMQMGVFTGIAYSF